MIKKYIIKKELNLEFRNNTSLFLITPTMCVLIIVFPILSENRFRVENDIFVIVQLLFLIIFTTLFSIRNPMEEQALIKELNFGTIKKIDYFSDFAYLGSGGFSFHSIYPEKFYPYLKNIDTILSKFAKKIFASRMLIVLEKKNLTI